MRSRDWAAAAVAMVLVLATFLPLVVPKEWWLRLLIFPQAQIAALVLIATVAVPLFLGLRRTAPIAIVTALLATLVYHLVHLLPYTTLWPTEVAGTAECPAESRVRVLVLNVKKGDQVNPETLALVRQLRPDLFLALETEPEWLRRTAPLRDLFQDVITVPRRDAWGMALYSRLPVEEAEVRYLVDGYVPSIKTAVRLRSGGRIHFYGLHPKPPLMHNPSRGDAELIRAAREIARSPTPAILAGDLNDVPWAKTTQRFQEISGMRDPRVGRAFDATFWPAQPVIGWPLDHAFATEGFRVIEFEPMRDVGSDHLPLVAEFCTGVRAADQ